MYATRILSEEEVHEMYIAGRQTALLADFLSANKSISEALTFHWSFDRIKIAKAPVEGVVDAIFWAEDIGGKFNVEAAILSGRINYYDHTVTRGLSIIEGHVTGG